MNAKSPALDLYINILRDVTSLKYFKGKKRMERVRWENLIARDIQIRLMANMFVQVERDMVYLTLDGLHMLEYNQDEE